ncbi:TetR/AcrR family transcriptional regulator [Gordonia sp. NPDC003425]
MPTEKPVRDASGAPRRARPADRKRQLVDHAASLFLERGYPYVSVADVARAAGVTAPSVYRHFTDKQALLGAAVLAGVDDLEACTDRALADPGRPIPELVDILCDLGVRHPESVSLWRWTSNYLTDEQNALVVARTRGVLARWGIAIAAQRPGVDERDCRALAWAALSVAGSLSVHRTRMSSARAHAELATLTNRLLALDPGAAPALPVPAPVAGLPVSRRDEILDAAAALFADRGYTDVGIDEIGAAVGITGPSVYKHFSSKLAILVGMGQRSAMRLEAGVMAAQASTADPAKLLGLLVESYVTVITSTPDLSVSFNSSGVMAGQPAATGLLDVQRRYVRRWIDLLARVHPGLRMDQGAVAVHAALSIVNDAVRMRRGTSRPDFGAQMCFLMKGVLDI